MVGKSKSGFGFKSGFEDFSQIRLIWFGFDLNVFDIDDLDLDLDLSFLKEVDLIWIWIWPLVDLDLKISNPQIHLLQNTNCQFQGRR